MTNIKKQLKKTEIAIGNKNVSDFWDYVNKTDWGNKSLITDRYYYEIKRKFPLSEKDNKRFYDIGNKYFDILAEVVELLMQDENIKNACIYTDEKGQSDEYLKVIAKQYRKGIKLYNDVRETEEGSMIFPLGIGDDSRFDLIWHIIGSGRDKFLSVINNPIEMFRMAQNHEFRESFSYVFN